MWLVIANAELRTPPIFEQKLTKILLPPDYGLWVVDLNRLFDSSCFEYCFIQKGLTMRLATWQYRHRASCVIPKRSAKIVAQNTFLPSDSKVRERICCPCTLRITAILPIRERDSASHVIFYVATNSNDSDVNSRGQTPAVTVSFLGGAWKVAMFVCKGAGQVKDMTCRGSWGPTRIIDKMQRFHSFSYRS